MRVDASLLLSSRRRKLEIPFGSFSKRTTLKGQHTPVNACHARGHYHKSPHRSVQQNRCGDFYTSAISLQQSSLLLFPSSPLGETERGALLPLILPPIQFRHGKKLFKLLHSLSLHLPSIQRFTIGLQPIKHIMLLNPMLRRIPMVLLQEPHHLIISC